MAILEAPALWRYDWRPWSSPLPAWTSGASLQKPRAFLKTAERSILMRFTETELDGLILVEPKVHEDPRGFFLEVYHAQKYVAAGIPSLFVQDNFSRSVKGTLRGLHYQLNNAQGKLVMVTEGAVFDVALDIRKGSPSFGKWYGIELSASNKRLLYIPPGFAHGFCVLTDAAGVLYKCTNLHSPDDERGIIWSDPTIAISWPVEKPLLSQKDQSYKSLAAMESELPFFSE